MAALFSLLVLLAASPVLGQSSGNISACTGDEHTSNNGLNFYTDCDSLQAGSLIPNTTYNNYWSGASIDECMDICAIINPRCYAVVYEENYCYAYDSNLFPRNSSGEIAIADASQLEVTDPSLLECPYEAYSIQTLPTGEEFQIICDADFGGEGGDYCPWEGYPGKCYAHADTLDECMQLCSDAHPLCKGVTWNVEMNNGYGNCYLKSDPQNAGSTTDGTHTHSALVTQKLYTSIDTTCPSTSPYEMGGNNYTVACKTGRVDTQNITSVHSNTLDDCLGSCSANTTEGCQGVLFDMSMADGYRNCYLLNDTGAELTGGANFTFATIAAFQNGTTPGGNGGGGGGSKAWIAGPVVGAVVALAAIVGAFLWWRRRKSRRNGDARGSYSVPPATDHKSPLQEGEEYPRPQTPIVEKEGAPTIRHEMPDPNSERLWPPQLHS